jgi:hypothetical protein
VIDRLELLSQGIQESIEKEAERQIRAESIFQTQVAQAAQFREKISIDYSKNTKAV